MYFADQYVHNFHVVSFGVASLTFYYTNHFAFKYSTCRPRRSPYVKNITAHFVFMIMCCRRLLLQTYAMVSRLAPMSMPSR
ncbi:hypothetical protein DFS33DRAFT_216391 [Desarmillaria ectypa]|nr:hypothetical protein DFS33DRAFT_216391 [Desarmillaria ectypa]